MNSKTGPITFEASIIPMFFKILLVIINFGLYIKVTRDTKHGTRDKLPS